MIKKPNIGPLALLILDGWGYREEITHNAIAQAHTPFWDSLWGNYPHCLLSGSGRCVGLPKGQMGNSEVGHLTIGAGRVIDQDLTRINQAITEGKFFTNPTLIATIDNAIQNKKAIHIAGLLSTGGVHSHEDHFKAIIDLAAQRGAKNVYIHAFLDGRDTPPKSAEHTLNNLIQYCAEKNCGKIISLIGRYFAMDRDHRWERVKHAWDLITNGTAVYSAATPLMGLHDAYARGETDEFVSATSIHTPDSSPIHLQEDDAFICMNFRSDRMRELVITLTDPKMNHFTRNIFPKIHCVTLTRYDETFNLPVAFPPTSLDNILGQYLSDHHLTQLRIAETEKYAHVTFFLNGGRETPFPGESRILIPSPKVTTYDLAPEMSAYELTDALVASIEKKQHDVIICNFANPDMVGHTGNLPATIKAIETIDICLKKIIDALKQVQGEALITADHGNAEILLDKKTNQPHTAHTSEPVPFIYVGRPGTITHSNGILADLAPTMLYLLGLEPPKEMTGQPLVALL